MISAPEPLTADHDLSAFDCGKPALNDWLRTYALANQAKGFTRVMVVRDGNRVVGFYGLAPTAVPPANLSRKVRTGRPPDPVPAILFGQLAVDHAYGGRGIGSALLRHALERCVAAAETIGGRAVIVRAIDREAEAFWQDCGFAPSKSDSSVLFRSLDDIAAWLAEAAP
ncbi:GNAT family N-acetyltransferase [Rhodospirillum sp. A1_3_36]|uniref:GNAT family N-acetyltransferase n=1 Tax=Rhodospirillum sp. A1_3_36 TaxID=3391666 RepID=UPI0039A48112